MGSNKLIPGVNDLATLNPELAAQWHPTKNGELTPDMVTAQSHKKVWWLCSNNHTWEAVIKSRHNGNGCPYCSGKGPGNHVLKGFNDLQTLNPNLASEWNYKKNGNLKPCDVMPGSNKKVWWICVDGHEWQANVNYRNGGIGCPYCSGRYAIEGVNDLQTVNPKLASEWHPIKNGSLTPNIMMPNSNKKVWWLGKCGHEWAASPNHRSRSQGCPYCRGLKVLAGFNDLSTLRSDIAIQWHPIKNGNLRPTDVPISSSKKVWWQCELGHEWQEFVYQRTRQNTGCPYCSGHRVLQGFNDLVTTNPELVKEWHPTKNGSLKPTDVTFGSNKKVWWLGKCGHEWQTEVYNRNIGNGCPYCAGKKVLEGFNDFETWCKNNNRDDLLKEWVYEKNKVLPSQITPFTRRKINWICPKGHEWQATVSDRSSHSGCPICREFHLEKITRAYLSNHSYLFEEQVKFDNLTGLSGWKLVSYDFGVYECDKLAILIECQGIQHYEPVDRFGGIKAFEKQQFHDELKREYAREHGIKLIEVPYTLDTYEKVEEFLLKELSLPDKS